MPFVLPTIGEINDFSGSNGLNVISTFSGCGGSSTGYKAAGYKVLVASEFMEKAADTYEANAPSTVVLRDDVRGISGADLLRHAGLGVGELDLFDGSPPCSSFSFSGLRTKAWGEEKHYSSGTHQRTDDLFFEYIRLIEDIKPKVFVAENVASLGMGTAKGYFVEIFRAMQACGYRVGAAQIVGEKLAIPQKRNRMIFVGVREDLGKDPVFPKPIDGRVTIGQACAGVTPPKVGEYQALREGTRTRQAWDRTDIFYDSGNLRHAYRSFFGFDARYNWFRLNPNDTAQTITAKVACLCHWSEPRTLSIHEAKRLSTFPDDFALTGKFTDQWERVGRAVPPMMMAHIGQTIAEEIFDVKMPTLLDKYLDNMGMTR